MKLINVNSVQELMNTIDEDCIVITKNSVVCCKDISDTMLEIRNIIHNEVSYYIYDSMVNDL